MFGCFDLFHLVERALDFVESVEGVLAVNVERFRHTPCDDHRWLDWLLALGFGSRIAIILNSALANDSLLCC